jgi:hypothetical protein
MRSLIVQVRGCLDFTASEAVVPVIDIKVSSAALSGERMGSPARIVGRARHIVSMKRSLNAAISFSAMLG